MSQAHKTPTMKSGTSKTSLAEEVAETNPVVEEGITRQQKNEFLEAVAMALADVEPGQGLPEIEVDRKVIAHFNRANMADFDDSLCFLYHNVKVYEKGRKEEAKKLERMSVEERNFGRLR